MSIQIKQDMVQRTVTSAIVGMKNIPTPIVEAKTLVGDQVYTIFSQADPRDPATQSAYWTGTLRYPLYALCDPDTGLFEVYNIQCVNGTSTTAYGKLMRTTLGKSSTSDKYNYLYEETLDNNFIPTISGSYRAPIFSLKPQYLLRNYGNVSCGVNRGIFAFPCMANASYNNTYAYSYNKIYDILNKHEFSSYSIQYPVTSFYCSNPSWYYETENGNSTSEYYYSYTKSSVTYYEKVTNRSTISPVSISINYRHGSVGFNPFGNLLWIYTSSNREANYITDKLGNTILGNASSIVPSLATSSEDGILPASQPNNYAQPDLIWGFNNNQPILAYYQRVGTIPNRGGIIRYNTDSNGMITSCDQYLEFSDMLFVYNLGWYAGTDPEKQGESYLLGISSRSENSTMYFITVDKNLTEKSRVLLNNCYFRTDGWESGASVYGSRVSEIYAIPQPVGYIKDGKKVGISFIIARIQFDLTVTSNTNETYMVCIDV